MATKKEMFDEIVKPYDNERGNWARTAYEGKVKSTKKERLEEVYAYFLAEKAKTENGEFRFNPSRNLDIPNDVAWQLKQLSKFCLHCL